MGPTDRAPCSARECPARSPIDDIDDAIDIDIALDHGCVVREGGSALCWGDPQYGALGTGAKVATLGLPQPPSPVLSTLSFATISVGLGMTCAVTTDGRAACWGGAEYKSGPGIAECDGQPCRPLPVLIPELDHVVQVVPVFFEGGAIALARRDDGSAVVVYETKQGFRLDAVTE